MAFIIEVLVDVPVLDDFGEPTGKSTKEWHGVVGATTRAFHWPPSRPTGAPSHGALAAYAERATARCVRPHSGRSEVDPAAGCHLDFTLVFPPLFEHEIQIGLTVRISSGNKLGAIVSWVLKNSVDATETCFATSTR